MAYRAFKLSDFCADAFVMMAEEKEILLAESAQKSRVGGRLSDGEEGGERRQGGREGGGSGDGEGGSRGQGEDGAITLYKRAIMIQYVSSVCYYLELYLCI